MLKNTYFSSPFTTFLTTSNATMETILFFETPQEWRSWLKANHKKATVQWVGFYKKGTDLPSITWPESVEEALCFGWIDGLRKRIDDKAYKIRFTPRKPRSHWSAVNIEMVEKLIKNKKMRAAGLAAWEKRTESRSKKFAYEQKKVALASEYEKQIREHPKAWAYFDEQLAPSYKKISIHWVMSAKQETTRQRRLNILIESCAEGLKIPSLRKK